MVAVWPWLGSLLALPLALAGHGDAIPKSYIIELTEGHTVGVAICVYAW
jgi:hypothetical protein